MLEIAVFALPIVVLKMAGGVLGGGPASVEATQTGSNADQLASQVTLATAWSDDQHAMAARVAAIRDEPFGRTPLRHHRPVPAASIEDPRPRVDSAPGLDATLTAIFRGGGNAFAVIDGRTLRVGDVVRSGWELAAVDETAVTVRNVATGDEVRLSIAK